MMIDTSTLKESHLQKISLASNKSGVLTIRPSKVRLDASTICQLRCPTCKTTSKLTEKTLGSKTLSFEDFKNFVDANPWIRSIELSSQGEVFLNSDLFKIIEYGHHKGITLSAETGANMNTIQEDVLEGLVKYRFSLINCAIDGASNETYKLYRREGSFDQVIANIKKINEFKIKYRSVFPRLVWQFIAFGHNEQDIPLAKEMAKKLGMRFYVKLAWDDFSPVKDQDLVRKESELGVASRKEYQEKYGKGYLSHGICTQLWKQPQLNPDGRVLGCAINHWGDFGNAFQEDLVGILNNEKMNYARSMLMGRAEERADIPCAQCPCYQKMKKENSWVFS